MGVDPRPPGWFQKGKIMRVGTVVQVKEPCLGNLIGNIGVVFNKYDGGVQVIFENSEYDGFSRASKISKFGFQTELEYFLNPVGFSQELSSYQFKNVMQLDRDFQLGKFDIVLRERKYEIGACV